MEHVRNLIDYWSRQSQCSDKEKLEGLMHSFFVTCSGNSGGFDFPIDLVCEDHCLNDNEYYDLKSMVFSSWRKQGVRSE